MEAKMLLVNLKGTPEKELNLWQLRNLLNEYKNAANREEGLQYKSWVRGYAYKKKYWLDLYISKYISAIYTGEITVSDENMSATIDLLNMFDPDTFFSFSVRKQDGEKETIRNVVVDVLDGLRARNSGDGHNHEEGNSVLEQEKGKCIRNQISDLLVQRHDRRISKIMSDGEKKHKRLIKRNLRREEKDLEKQKRISEKNVEYNIDKINENIDFIEQQILHTLREMSAPLVYSEMQRYKRKLKKLRKHLQKLKKIKDSYENVEHAKIRVQQLQSEIVKNKNSLQENGKKVVDSGIQVMFGSESRVFYQADINKFIAGIKKPDANNLESCEQMAFNLYALKDNENLSEKQKARIANALNAFYKKYEQLKEKTENKSNASVLNKATSVVATCKQKIAEKAEQIKNLAHKKQERDEHKTSVLKPLFVRSMPYAASFLLLVGTTVLFANDSAHADNDGKIKKEVKAINATSVEKDNNTVRASVQDLARARDNFVAQKIKPIETDVVVKSGSEVAKKTIETNVVKNNANVKSSDKFYDSRLDKFFGNKKSDVLQKIQNRMQNVDLDGISAERVAYTMGVYSAYGYNIDVLNNFVNGAELNSDQIKELNKVIDLAKPHGTGVRDMAAAHITSREIHEMCADGGKVNAAKKTVRAKSGVKTQISNEKITQQDMLRMHKNIIDSGKYSLTSEQHKDLTDLLLGEHKDCLNPDEAAELTKLLLLAGFDKDIVSRYVGQRIYSEPVIMPDNYVQRVETQNGQKKPVWYSRCFRISRYSR